MKNNITFIAIILLIFGLVIAVLMKSKIKQSGYHVTNSQNTSDMPEYNIAIMIPATHPALEEIQQGFLDTLRPVLSYRYDVYNANGDRALMRHQAEEIVAKNYDLIFTIATAPALIMKEVVQQRSKDIAMVAGAVDSPVEIGLVQSLQSSGNNITVVTGIDDFEQQLDVLRYVKPQTKSILLVYNSTPGLEKKRSNIEFLCRKKGIGLQSVAIFSINDVLQKVSTFIAVHDVVLILKDNMVVSGIESLINLCNKMHKTLYASDLNSGDKGAVLSFGVHEYDDGVESAYKAIEILKNHKKPSDVPSSMNTRFKVKVNTQFMQLQDLDISEELLFLMKSGEVI